ncbi:hypothetical protein CI41S_49330 [Bradyrhizobium ivorense]|nr:hypothetical protein CI41S_49330 [Bradyrhizobium ivorense]
MLRVMNGMSNETVAEREKLTRDQRKARDAERRQDAVRAMREHELAQEAIYDNMKRLRAERLAREAQAKK